MRASVTDCAQCDQVRFGVISQTTPKVLVMDFQVRHRTTGLTPPAIAMQHLLPQGFVRFRIEPQSHGLRANRAHEDSSLKPSRNSCLCSPGRNLKNLVIENSSVSGSPLSRLAPARKSAQIISRQ
jgi:hypothetical protein